MRIIIRKKQLILRLFLLLLLFTSFCLFKSWDIWRIHRFMPQPGAFASYQHSSLVTVGFAPARKGYSVLIDLDTLTLTLYQDGEQINSWPVSGGRQEYPSPTGSWIVTDISNWGSGFGGSWIAISVPWGVYGIHGTVEPWAVGSDNISHGCIRMKNSDVAELKKYLYWGVPVQIKHDGAPFRALKDGKVGSDVLRLQEMLKLLGYYAGEPDGRFGSATLKALRQFQADERITLDGIVGWESWNLLNERVAKLQGASSPGQYSAPAVITDG